MAYTSSYWETESFLSCDIIIIGSGIVGLSTACSLLEKRPELKITVLERGLLPSGASTRNAGFACFGSVTEILSDLKSMSENEVVSLVKKRYDGLQLLRQRLGHKDIDFQLKGGHELLLNKDAVSDRQIEHVNKLLHEVFNENAFSRQDDLIEKSGIKNNNHGMIFTPLEGQIHTGKMMDALLKKAAKLGARIITGCFVESVEESSDKIKILVKDTVNNATLEFKSDQLAVCTNGFSRQFFPDEDIFPARGQVLVTNVIPGLKLNGTYHADEGYIYFRDLYGRVLLGGARNLDIAGETSSEFSDNEKITVYLRKFLAETILSGTDFTIEHQWSGIMGVGNTKTPIIERVSPKIVAGIRMGGMGVALGTKTGEMVSEILIQ